MLMKQLELALNQNCKQHQNVLETQIREGVISNLKFRGKKVGTKAFQNNGW